MRKKRKSKWLTVFFVLKWAFPLFLVLLLPLYYKVIWPPMIGNPAKAETVDVLAFWGAVFGGIITLIGVFMTIRFSQGEIEQTLHQQEKDHFIKGFGATVLEINSITFEMKKFRNYLQQLHTNLQRFSDSGVFQDIVIEFDTKDDYKKIRGQVKPDLEIICNRFEGKAAHADGFVYYQITILSGEIKKFQTQLYGFVDRLNESTSKPVTKINETIFKEINQSLDECEKSLKIYKEKLGDRFIQYSKEDGYLE
ncbi:hypothetical protein ACFSO7_02430 [Bacillus sp. CGMCC 1.16607]|uniref:hypothetical protein n=1 Tax=Bacillus sp. CGMCC 1.16607 TaxID=3351842 RepID=UPI00362B9CA1